MVVHAPVRQPSFDFIRVAAALAVLYSHSFALYGLPEPQVAELGENVGTLAVTVFFAVSGFLICQSWEHDSHVTRFAVRRALRILPGLFVAVAFTTFIAGAISTRLPLAEYLTSRTTWAYFINNVFLIAGVFSPAGAFEDTPHQGANGSLWTLRYEVLMYAMLALVALTARLRAFCVGAFLVFAISWVAMAAWQVRDYSLPLPLVWRVGLEFDAYRIARLGAFFFGGSCLFLFRRRVPVSTVAAGMLLVACLTVPSDWAVPTLIVAVPYLTFVAAHRLPARLVDVRGWDLSYGIYIYAFPVQQLVSGFCLEHGLGWFISLAMSTAITLALAAMSWRVVERPALRLKERLGTAPWRVALAK
jgi:peptidoglycan/LPS O-acetylase OafA/YrhL